MAVAYAFAVNMGGTTVPTPLYPLYQRDLGVSGLMVTVVFAMYALGVIAALVWFGRASDHVGRRPVLRWGLALSAASGVVFLAANGVAGLLVGRLLSGLSAGLFAGTATAALVDLVTADRRPWATLVATAVSMGGLGTGPVLSGVLAEWVPWPLRLSFAVHLGLLAVAACGLYLIPEPMKVRPANDTDASRGAPAQARPHTACVAGEPSQQSGGAPAQARPKRGLSGRGTQPAQQRPRVPDDLRVPFVAAATAGFAGFAVLGLFGAVAPGFLATVLDLHNRALAGVVVGLVFAGSLIGQVLCGRTSAPAALPRGCWLLVAGLAAVAAALAFRQLAFLVAGGVVAGVGQGLVFRAGLTSMTVLSPPERRGEVASALYVVYYLALAVPIVGLGLVSRVLDLRTAGLVFSVAVGALALGARWQLAHVERPAPT
ncbi:MAG: MFS transporter [Acidimicrobiia bacterium]